MGSNASFTANVLAPAGTVSVTLYDDGLHGDGAAGDSVFGETFSGTAEEGRYGVEFQGWIDLATERVQRSADTGFVVESTGAAFAGGLTESTPDDDGNGLFDALVFEQPVDVARAGSYRLVAALVDSQGEPLAHLGATATDVPAQGVVSTQSTLSGEQIARHGIDVGTLPCDSAADHVTQPYLVSDFDPPPPPVISMLLPTQGPPSGGNAIEIMGSALRDATEVWIGQELASVLVTGPGSLTVEAPPHPGFPRISAVGGAALPVRVVTPWGSTKSPQPYVYRE